MAPSRAASPAVTPTSHAFRAIFVYDETAPATVVASVIEGRSETWEDLYFTAVVACPSPCADANFAQQTITYLTGSSWAGEKTVDGTTTSWGCVEGGAPGGGLEGMCYVATAKDGETINHNGTSTSVGNCFLEKRSKMMFVTEGFDQYFNAMPDGKVLFGDREESVWKSFTPLLSCSATATGTATPTAAATSKPASKTGDDAPKQTDSSDSESDSPSPSDDDNDAPPNAGSAVYRNMALLLGATALTAIIQL